MATEDSSPAVHGQLAVIRIHRGATVMGTDAALGTVHQIIMDRHTGELQALVLATGDAERLELPASHVQRAAGSTVYVNIGLADLQLHPELVRPYNPDRYVPVREHPLVAPAATSHAAHSSEHPLVSHIERDAIGVVVPEVMVPSPVISTYDRNGWTDASMSTAAEVTFDADGDDNVASTIAVPVITPGFEHAAPADAGESASSGIGASGLEYAVNVAETAVPGEGQEEGEFMEGSEPPVNPVIPGETSDEIYDDETNIASILDESQHSYTRSVPPEAAQRSWGRQGLMSASSEETGSRLSWVPAAALGALIVGIAVWSTLRTIRRGRRKAAEAARNARESVRDSMRDAGKSAVELAQTVRASAQEMAANPRDTATDTFSKISDIPARYRWFRRGMRVGSRTAKLRRN